MSSYLIALNSVQLRPGTQQLARVKHEYNYPMHSSITRDRVNVIQRWACLRSGRVVFYRWTHALYAFIDDIQRRLRLNEEAASAEIGHGRRQMSCQHCSRSAAEPVWRRKYSKW